MVGGWEAIACFFFGSEEPVAEEPVSSRLFFFCSLLSRADSSFSVGRNRATCLNLRKVSLSCLLSFVYLMFFVSSPSLLSFVSLVSLLSLPSLFPSLPFFPSWSVKLVAHQAPR